LIGKTIDRTYTVLRNGQQAQVTIYTDAGTPVQAYRAIKAYIAEKSGDGYAPQQETSVWGKGSRAIVIK
jgi:hypothetical protein